MTELRIPFSGGRTVTARLSCPVDVLSMKAPRALDNPGLAIAAALEAPIASRPLAALAAETAARQAAAGKRPTAVVVVSDNTRPVPYRGESGILMPIIRALEDSGFARGDITVLVGTGTHRAMSEAELRAMLDPEVFENGIRVLNHDCEDEENLVCLGLTERGNEVFVNRAYMEADFRILTGLVESHFMAGASGGRKSVCPGIVGKKSTYVFHGAAMMAHPGTRDLYLAGNPCHEESLFAARMAGVDFIVNVTLDHSFSLTGVFAGALEAAHEAAVAKVRSYVGIPFSGEYDIVVSHAGFVGRNHYQAAKTGTAIAPMLAGGALCILVADNHDADPVGGASYRTVLGLLKQVGVGAFERLLMSPDWPFVLEQWQVQMWCKLFCKLPFARFVYFAPQLSDGDWKLIPGLDGIAFLDGKPRKDLTLEDAARVIERAVELEIQRRQSAGLPAPRVAWLPDGPYGIPVHENA